ncbi:MAG TPA: hypothetical protein VHW09_30900 [Bryobacteraceae bacterium]|nr:hypothetical protein [Bryobacteraceae bacterium]
MPKAPSISLTKMIEATKLQPRTLLPLGVPPVTVPYGALVEPVGSERDRQRFHYLGELFECTSDLFLSATGWVESDAVEEGAEPAPAPSEGAAEEAAPAGPRLQWQRVQSSNHTVVRTAVPGGWLVALNSNGLTFVPDATHQWDGGSTE